MPRACFTPEQRQEIRDLHAEQPSLRYKQIAAQFGCSIAYVAAIICGRGGKEPSPPMRTTRQPPACTVQQPGSIIRPIPLSRLTARR